MLDKVASCRLPLHRGSTVHPDRATQQGRNAMRLMDKIGIVTAAGSGMGRAGAVRFAKEGAKVAVVDLDGASVDSVVKEITAAGGKAIGITADLREDANARRIVRETANPFGGLDFVWNHSAIRRRRHARASTWRTSHPPPPSPSAPHSSPPLRPPPTPTLPP